MTTHVVYLVMTIAFGADTPKQMASESSMDQCLAVIRLRAAAETGNQRGFWYCQPAVANITLGPRP
jgi:hypothetical protein